MTIFAQKFITRVAAFLTLIAMMVLAFGLSYTEVKADDTPHRYWRINITEVTSSGFVGVNEIEFRATPNGADQAGSGTASASTSGFFPPSNAFDNDTETAWAVLASTAWIKYDFGSGNSKEVSEISVFAGNQHYPVDFDIQYSDNNSTWTTAWSVSNQSWSTSEAKIYTDPNYSAGDTDPPTPNPSTFATAPDDASTTSVDMTATTATDDSTPVEYLFTFDACDTNGGTGGTSSDWQESTTYTDTGLEAGKCYGYSVKARDSEGNETVASSVVEATTDEEASPSDDIPLRFQGGVRLQGGIRLQ